MKIRYLLEDFRVDEVPALPRGHGPFALYRLKKTGWTTPDAIDLVLQAWKTPWEAVSFGGLKDRHAITTQHFTIHGGKGGNLGRLREPGVSVEFIGHITQPFTSQNIDSNRFRLVLRDIPASNRQPLEEALEQVGLTGLPNYFDDQRFGSVHSLEEGFVGLHLVKGAFDKALRLALAGTYSHDSAPTKAEKKTLLDHWGDWQYLLDNLPRSHARSLCAYLRDHPTKFRGAMERLRPELKGLYLAAYQSWIWNQGLALWLTENAPASDLIPLPGRLFAWPAPLRLQGPWAEQWRSKQLTLPCRRAHLPTDHPDRGLFDRILAKDDLKLDDLRVPGTRELFFSRGFRPVQLPVGELRATWKPDDQHPGQLAAELDFRLPRSSYATMLVKRLQAAMGGQTTETVEETADTASE